eukprot:6483683-Amphidinium_carterae.1
MQLRKSIQQALTEVYEHDSLICGKNLNGQHNLESNPATSSTARTMRLTGVSVWVLNWDATPNYRYISHDTPPAFSMNMHHGHCHCQSTGTNIHTFTATRVRFDCCLSACACGRH